MKSLSLGTDHGSGGEGGCQLGRRVRRTLDLVVVGWGVRDKWTSHIGRGALRPPTSSRGEEEEEGRGMGGGHLHVTRPVVDERR